MAETLDELVARLPEKMHVRFFIWLEQPGQWAAIGICHEPASGRTIYQNRLVYSTRSEAFAARDEALRRAIEQALEREAGHG